MGIRNAARALIINNGKILINKNQNTTGVTFYGLPNGAVYYDIPGGGQNQYETLEEAVKRECLEESGYTVAIDRLAAIYEEISMNEGFRDKYEQYAHKVHFLFICRLVNETVKPLGEKDLDLIESIWVDIPSLKNLPLYPRIIKTNLEKILKADNILYLGSERVC